MKYSIYIKPPSDFDPKMHVSSCYCEHLDKILLVKRHPKKPQGDTWGVPAGKMEENENPRMTVIREVQEEIGLNIDDPDLEMIGTLYCRLAHLDYVYHMFRKRFSLFPCILLALEEHTEMHWVTVDEALQMPLIAGGAEALKYYKYGVF